MHKPILTFIFFFSTLLAQAGMPSGAPSVTATAFISTNQNYQGTPGAEIRDLQFSDGMHIKLALYAPASGDGLATQLAPIGVVAGYAMDISYLNMLAVHFAQQGYPVFLVQPPGNGSGAVFSGFSDERDGYHNSIEGFASMYMEELGRVVSEHYGRKVMLMGHSRAGYQIRAFLSGLRYVGVNEQGLPLLESQPQSLERAKQYFLSIVSLYSPLRPDRRLVEAARGAPETMRKILELERLSHQEKDRTIKQASAVASLLAGTSPLNLLWGPFALPAALVNAKIAGRTAEFTARTQAQMFEALAYSRTIDLILGHRELDNLDFLFLGFMRQKFGSEMVPSSEELKTQIEQVRWLIGGYAEKFAVGHLLKYSSRKGPSQVAAEEMNNLAGAQDLLGWKTIGVDANGSPYSMLRAIHGVLRKTDFPYMVVAASGDGDNQGLPEEKRFLKALDTLTIEGGHGGAVLNHKALDELTGKLSEACAKVLTR